MQREIKNELLLTTGENLSVEIPTADCILGDKLTAFAPHTTGILLRSGKELEIVKQLFDTATAHIPGIPKTGDISPYRQRKEHRMITKTVSTIPLIASTIFIYLRISWI